MRTAGEDLREDEREGETDEVRDEEQTANQRAAAAERPRPPAMIEDRERARVDIGAERLRLGDGAHTGSRSFLRGTYA